MKHVVYLNGIFVDAENATISIFDRGFLYGDGLFETMRARQGKIFRIQQHLERLYESAQALFIEIKKTPEEMEAIIRETLERNQLTDAVVRLQITRGQSSPGLTFPEPASPTLVVQVRPYQAPPNEFYQEGVNICLLPDSASKTGLLPQRIKSTQYLSNILAKKWADDHGCYETIFLDDQGHICEGTVSNFFLIKDGILKTPHANEFVLKGITRQVVLEIAKQTGMEFLETNLTAEEAYSADEIFLTNTGIEILPVKQVDEKILPFIREKRMTQTIHQHFLKKTSKNHFWS